MIQIFIAGVLWGIIGIFVKELNSLGADVSLTGFMRMSFAFIIMLAVSLVKHGRNIIIRDRKTIILCAILGIVCHGFFNIFYINSIRLNGMGIACVLMYTAPVFTAIASWIIFHEKFSHLKVFALTVNIIGCVLTVAGWNIFSSDVSAEGILSGLGSGFCYGMVTIAGRSACEKTDALIISAYSYLFAALFLLVFTNPPVMNAFGNTKILGMGFLHGLIPTSIAYLVYYNGLGKVQNMSKVPVIASIEPVTAVIVGMLLYNERMDAANFTGVAVVLVSIMIMMKAK